MSGSVFTETVQHQNFPLPQERDVTLYLEDLASKLKENDLRDPGGDTHHWNLINRVLAYAASAEQHIAEQQSRIRELENLSTTDELTGLHNRRSLKEFLNRAISSARRHNETGVVAFLDLDQFKQINDTYGHDAGDRVLKKMADIIQENLRDTDFVARLGGDEFVFILDKANQAQAINRAKKIRQMICESSILIGKKEIPLSASIGIATYDGQCNYDTVMGQADKAMYQDKKSRKQLK